VPVSAPALGVAGAGPAGDTDRGESAEKGWSLVCNGAGLFCDEELAARPGGGKRDVTGESPAGPGELRLRAQALRADRGTTGHLARDLGLASLLREAARPVPAINQ